MSCNQNGYGCDGGWLAHQYHMSTTDACGGAGAVLEADFPYAAADTACNCPYPHAYTIDGWQYVGDNHSVPSTDALKQAIYTYGPVSVAVYVGAEFQGYTDGIFNAAATGTVNHAVVLVGWNDNGGNGYWILRNSWSAGWGESGYMRIAYGCADVGYGAAYVDYVGTSSAAIEVTPASLDFGDVAAGDSATLALTVKNVGVDALVGSATGLTAPFSIVGSADYDLAAGESQVVTVQFEPALLGSYSQTLNFSGGGGVNVAIVGSGTGSGLPADNCADAPLVGDGSYSGDSTPAGTFDTASCGGGGSHDVWWRFRTPYSGLATIDTVGSDFDTVLTVYATCGGSELACNDDAGGAETSSLELSVLPATDYWVRVAGVGGATGSVVLNISTDPYARVVAGRVIDDSSHGVAGVAIGGLDDAPVSNANGYFTGHVAYGATVTVTPTKTGWTFDPASRSFENLTSDVSDIVFVGDADTVSIRGRVTDENGAGVGGVLLRGFPDRVVTAADGTYTALVDYGFSGTVIPYLDSHAFEPGVRSFTSVTAARTGQDFVAYVLTGGLRITLLPESVAELGVAWRVDDGVWRASGETQMELLTGMHVIEYASVAGWDSPLRELLVIRTDRVVDVIRSYVPIAEGSEPADGTDDGKGDDTAAPLVDANDVSPLPVVAPLACGGGGLVSTLPFMLGGWGVLKVRGRRR